jgi:drug/metabolite transporter (DMT)-like permease
MATYAEGRTATLPTLALLLAMLLWASSFIALKLAFRTYDPMVVIFGRMFVASLCFLLVARRITRSLEYRRGDYKLILLMAFFEPCLYFLFEAKAVANTTASQAGMITAILPILVMVAAATLLKERIRGMAWLGALIAVAGVGWLTLASSPSEDAPNPALGNFLEFLAMLCATGYTITMKTLTRRYSPLLLTAVQAVAGCLFYFPILFFPGITLPDQFHLVPALAVVYLGAVITLGAYGLYNYGLKYVDASRAAAFVNLIPLFAVFLGWLVLGERFNLEQLAAAGVIMFGVYLSRR